MGKRVWAASVVQGSSVWVVWGGGDGWEDGVSWWGGGAAMAAGFWGLADALVDGGASGGVEGEADEVVELQWQGIGVR